MTVYLPPPARPTRYADFAIGRHPHQNTFDLMPYRGVHTLVADDIVNVNIATYVDPYSEYDYQRLAAETGRWMHGLLVRINAIQLVDYSQVDANTYPSDRVFNGTVTNHNANLEVVGVVHPEAVGWLAFTGDVFDGTQPKNIAHLKARVGQITTAQAASHTAHYLCSGRFSVNNMLLT